MPDEIADSDAESDFDIHPSVLNPPQPNADQNVPDVTVDVNFDDFISQTQSLSRHSDEASPTGSIKRSTGSTQKLFNSAHEAQQGLAGSSNDRLAEITNSHDGDKLPSSAISRRKRGHSDMERSSAMYSTDEENTGSLKKRRGKTYGGASRLLASSQEAVLNSPRARASAASAASTESSIPGKASPSLAQESSVQNEEYEEEKDVLLQQPRQRDRRRRTTSLLRESRSDVGQVYTSKSSMGDHQSINIDCRQFGPGLDINANPFGNASQVSIDDYADPIGRDGQNHGNYDQGDLSSTLPLTGSPSNSYLNQVNDGIKEQPTSHSNIGRSKSTDPSLLSFNPPSDTQMLTPIATSSKKRSKSYHPGFANDEFPELIDKTAKSTAVTAESRSTETNTAGKKRGKKSKNSRVSPVPSIQDNVENYELNPDELDIEIPKEQYKLRASKARGGAHEPDSHLADCEEEQVTKKNGRKKSLKAISIRGDLSSPAKLPTSELNLSDEAIIGFPKENYKPRPSRSRRAAVAEEAITPATVQFEPQHEDIDTKASSPSITPKGKKAKKAKMKRAKTIVAAKKSEPMLSDGEHDFVWVEERPAKVMLSVPADIAQSRIVKNENSEEAVSKGAEVATVGASQMSNVDNQENMVRELRTESPGLTKITIEIPSTKETQPEPKKRGRKRKKTAEAADNEDHTEPVIEDRQTPPQTSQKAPSYQSHTSRHALAEKTLNTHLPPPSSNSEHDNSKVKDRATLATPSPTKPHPSFNHDTSPTIGKPSPAKKPAHSPINPTGGKGRYRIGLSRRTPIPSLLKMVRKPEPKATVAENDDKIQETMRKWREAGVLD